MKEILTIQKLPFSKRTTNKATLIANLSDSLQTFTADYNTTCTNYFAGNKETFKQET